MTESFLRETPVYFNQISGFIKTLIKKLMIFKVLKLARLVILMFVAHSVWKTGAPLWIKFRKMATNDNIFFTDILQN